MTRLEGRNLFEWRHEYTELAARFCEYADHTHACYAARGGHKHTPLADDRIVCSEAPCTCGLLIILSVLNPTITYSVQCPDKPIPLPVRPQPLLNSDGAQLHVFGIPVFESPDVPDNVIVLGDVPKPTDNGY